MATNQPAIHNFDPYYKAGGVSSMILRFFSDSAKTVPFDLTGGQVLMEFVSSNKAYFAYITEGMETSAELTSLVTIENNVMTFQKINSMDIPALDYEYDLKFIRQDGFVIFLMKGTIPVEQNLSGNG